MPDPLQPTPPLQIIRNASWLRKHARLDRRAVRLLTRTGLDWTHKYPAIAATRLLGWVSAKHNLKAPFRLSKFSHIGAQERAFRQAVLKMAARRSANLRKTGDRYDQKIDPWHGFGIDIGDWRRRSGFWGRR
jgi:hypothetical protein